MYILLLLLIPLVGALASQLIGKSSQSTARTIALASSLISLAVFLFGANQFLSGNPEVFALNKPWLPEMNVSFNFKVDGIGLLLIGLAQVLVPLIILSTSKISYDKPGLLYALILLTQVALVGVFSANDIFLFYFFFEIALVPVYFIALTWGNEQTSKASFKMFVYTIFGSLIMLVAMVYLYSKGQTADLEALKSTASYMTPAAQRNLFWAFMLAFAIKMPLFPMHTWQPDAYTTSPTPATMLLSGLLSKMGVFGLLILALPMAPLASQNFAHIVIIFAVIGLIYGSIIAIKQNSLKKLIAYSSFAHMGLMAAGVFSGTLEGMQGAVFQMLAHGVNAVGLFFVAKIIFEKTGSRDLSALGGINRKAPALSILFMIILLGSVALPLTNGFVGEFLMLKGVFEKTALWGIIAGISIILGAVYMLRFFQKSMFGEFSEATTEMEDISGSEKWTLLIISALVLIMGIFPNAILKISEPASEALLNYLATI
ncbi:complex I subunit 4 family protein [Jiulongibacter sp. NS-SX5]|uniref:complex I subunit 4 family protein n=1 Tax=Jiulongibacter sp. NS-SX5 TaxID=3463854 RepID=UPI004058ABDB